MSQVIYSNNGVTFSIERKNQDESSVQIEVDENNTDFIWISNSEKEEFIKDLQNVFDKYRI